jgi:hypothetical protein
MSTKKISSNKTNSVIGNNSNGSRAGNWETNHSRIFEPTRSKVEWELDTLVTNQLTSYEDYLKERYGRNPNMNGVVEAVLLDGLLGHSDFQKWLSAKREKKRSEETEDTEDNQDKNKINEELHDDDMLENLGKPFRQNGTNQIAERIGAATIS